MLEAPDQIQNSVLPESPVLETPQPVDSSQDEAALTDEITELWRLHADYKGTIKNQTENLQSLRAELGRKLAEMKQALARPGRNGQWSGWLKERRISRATADRLVAKYERSLNPDGNRLTAQFTEPTEQEIQNLFHKIAPTLRRVLRTPASVYRFIDLLTSSLEGVDRRVTEEGFAVVQPCQHSEASESVPAESPVEPTPLIDDIVLEANSDPV